jgi:hypothetical protein
MPPAAVVKPIPPGVSTPQSEADAAHFYGVKEDSPLYRTST